MSEAHKVIQAEKGRNLSPASLHLRLRVVEVIVLVSLTLNLIQGYVGYQKEQMLEGRIEGVSQRTVPPQGAQ